MSRCVCFKKNEKREGYTMRNYYQFAKLRKLRDKLGARLNAEKKRHSLYAE